MKHADVFGALYIMSPCCTLPMAGGGPGPIMDGHRITNGFEIYQGTHASAVADRFQNHVMLFFSQNLCFTSGCT
jgi:hypothetical protein